MTDAVSSIAFGIDTGSGLADLVTLREAFAGLKKEIRDFNDLKANAQGISGVNSSKNELTTLGAELKAAQKQIGDLERQLQGLGKSQMDAVRTTTAAVKQSVEEQARAVIDSEKRQAAETLAIQKQTTRNIEEEVRKRASFGSSAKVAGGRVGISEAMKPDQAELAIIKSMQEAQARLLQDNAAKRSRLDQEAAAQHAALVRAGELNDVVTIQNLLRAHEEFQIKKVALEQEANSLHAAMMLESAVKDITTIEGMLEAHKAFQARRATIERDGNLRHAQMMLEGAVNDEATIQGMIEAHKHYQTQRAATEAEGNRLHAQMMLEGAVKDEATIQGMIHAHEEFQARRTALDAEENRIHAQLMLEGTINDEVTLQNLLKAHEEFQIKKLALEREAAHQHAQMTFEGVVNDQVALQNKLEAEAALLRKQTIQDHNYNTSSLASRVGVTRRAAGLVGDGSNETRTHLATELYGPAAVSAVGRLNELEAQLNQTRERGHAAVSRSTDLVRMNSEAMKEAHSFARGLAGGLDQLWVTWGSVAPLVAGAAITGSMVKMLKAGEDVEYQLQFLRALAEDGKKGGVDLNKFLTINDGTMSSVKDAAGGIRALSQAGLDQQKAFKALPDVLDLAAIGEMNVSQAALTATGVMNAFGLKVQDIGHVGDVFATVAASSNTSVVGMTESMKQASTVGELFHVSMEEAAASIGVLAQRNIMGTAAGTSLTNALKSLYEPSEKAKRTLAALNLTTDDGHGGLKAYSQLLDELREKLSRLDDSSKTVILGSLTDQRGAKVISAITSDYEKYTEFLNKTKSSQDFMSKATLELEDTVKGSFQRMSNSFEGSLLKAFEEAKPSVRELQTELTKLAKSDELVGMLTHIAMAGVNITRAFIDHARAIAVVAAGYVALRVVSGLVTAYAAWKTSVAASSAALVTNTTAVAASSTVLEIEATAANAAAAASVRFAGGIRMVVSSLGPISMLLMAAYTGYELLTAGVDKNENAIKRSLNTADTILDYYDRQIAKLDELNNQLLDGGRNAEDFMSKTARAQLQAELATSVGKTNGLQRNQKNENGPQAAAMMGIPGGLSVSAGANQTKASEELQQELKNQERLQNAILALDNKQKELQAKRGLNKKLNDKRQVSDELEDLIKSSGLGLKGGGTAASRAIGEELKEWQGKLEKDTEAYRALATLLDGYRKRINDAKDKMTVPSSVGRNDAYRAKQIGFDGEIQRIKDDEKSDLNGVKSKEKRGEIGELQAVAQNLAIVTKARADDLAVFIKKEDAAAAQEHRLADRAAIENKRQANERADVEARNEMSRQVAEIETKWNEESLKSEAETLRKKGRLYDAYVKEFGSKHELEMGGLQSTVDDKTLPKDQRDAAQKRKDYLTTQFNVGSDTAKFDEKKGEFQKQWNEMQEQLAAIAEKSARTNESARSPGFITDLTAAGKGDDIRTEAAKSMQDLLDSMAQLAEKTGNPELKSSVARMGTELVKEANRSRDAWIAAGKSIEKSLSDSFGKGGKAVGGIVSALIKQRETQKGIDDDLKKQKADPKNQDSVKQIELENKAREESTQLQLSSYADISASAKGFFDEHSKGYAMMQSVERVFRAFEMAESIRSFMMKSGFTTAFTELFVASKTAEMSIQQADTINTVTTEGAKQTSYGITALAAALAKPFPENLVAFAAVAAMLVAIGVAVKGGSGPSTGPSLSEERQKYTGTGYVYDKDSKNNPYDWELQKSESMTKAMDHLKDNSDIALRYSSSQLVALEKINNGIAGMAATAVSSAGLRGTHADELALGVGSSKSFLAFNSSKTALNDSGIMFDPATGSVGSILKNGVKATSYADTTTKSSSFWGLFSSSHDNTSYSNLDSDLLSQMNLVVKGLYSTVTDAAKFFGKNGSTLENALQGVSLSDAGLDKISLKGMSSDDVEKTLNAAFSKLGDVMAQAAMPGLNEFEKAGEGYLETLIRVSTGIDSAQYSLQRLGITMVDYTSVINKQGDVATEIVRTSVALKEGATGIADIVQNFAGSAADLVDTYTKLTGIRNTMRVTGISNADVTSSMVKGAGGLDNLSTGMNDFMDNFFTDAEKAAAKVALLQEEFVKIGQPMPKSKDEFKQVAQGIDRTTEAGQTLYGALIALSGQFADLSDTTGKVDPALAKQNAVVSGLIDTAKHWLDIMGSAKGLVDSLDDALAATGKGDRTARISELQDLLNSGVGSFEQQLEIAGQLKDLVLEKYQTEKANAEKLLEFGRGMAKYVTDLKTGDLSPLTNKGKLEAAMSDYQTALGNTTSSDETVRDNARGQIQDKASTLLDLAHIYYASSQSYTDVFNNVSKQLTDLGVSATNSGMSVQALNEGQLNELQKLRSLAKGIEASASAEYESTVTQLATQITLMQQMDGSLVMLTQLFAGMPAQLAMSLGNKGVSLPGIVSSNNTAQDQIELMYSSYLHRKSDADGMQFWLTNYQNGNNTMDSIRDLIKNSPEARGLVPPPVLNGSHANGLDYVPFNGYVAELHKGEGVLTADENRVRRTNKAAMTSTASFSADERDAMAAEIAELRKAMDRMVESNMEAAQAMARAYGAASDQAAEKIVEGTKEALGSSDYNSRNKPTFN